LVDHHTWVFVGDGCLMEGISHEAASLAGVWQLGRLIVFYDDNGISIDGDVNAWFADDTPARFAAYGWQVISHVDGHDASAIHGAILAAKADTLRPTLICCKTSIGRGAPTKAGGHDVHGAPLGAQEMAAMRAHLHWPHRAFEIPQDIYRAWDARNAGTQAEQYWEELWSSYQQAYPTEAQEFRQILQGFDASSLEQRFMDYFQSVQADPTPMATRKASYHTLNTIAPHCSSLVGGSADLSPSNLTRWQGTEIFSPNHATGRYLQFGVREFGMTAIISGIQLHSGLKAFGATFLMFSEYARNAIRMAALMRIAPIYVFTHDSIGLGEDGPTHQPIEQAASLRLVPNLSVWRPADALETAVAWHAALLSQHRPHALLLSRQNLAPLPAQQERHNMIAKGAYTVHQSSSDPQPELILLATGSEVGLALQAAHQLEEQYGHCIRVVSMPSCDVFDQQDNDYRQALLPAGIKKMALEAGVSALWWRYVGSEGHVMGIDQFGASAPAEVLFEHFALTSDRVVEQARALLGA
jgi:transketolase